MGKTRIGRIARGEKVLQVIISEPLQEEFDRGYEIGGQLEDLQEELQEKYPDADLGFGIDMSKLSVEDAKRLVLLKDEVKQHQRMLWQHVHGAYNTWNKRVGIRDGYCLVEMPEKKPSGKGFSQFMRHMLENMDLE